MPDDTTSHDLRQQLGDLDAEIAELRSATGNAGTGGEVRDSEEIATDLTSREEQQAVLGILQRRREAILERLKQLGE
jgi:hypothetical protein